jgi:hypothetical protein
MHLPEQRGIPDSSAPRLVASTSCTRRWIPALPVGKRLFFSQDDIDKVLAKNGQVIAKLPYNSGITQCITAEMIKALLP